MQLTGSSGVSVLFEKGNQAPDQGQFREESLSQYSGKDLLNLVAKTDKIVLTALQAFINDKLKTESGKIEVDPFLMFVLEEALKGAKQSQTSMKPDFDKLKSDWGWYTIENGSKFAEKKA